MQERVHKYEHTEKKIKLMLHPSFKYSSLRYPMSFVVFWSYAWDYDDNQWEGTIAVGLFNGKITEEYYGFH